MPTVYSRLGDRSKFHREQTCAQLNKLPARGTPHPIQELDLMDIPGHARPCKTCYTDARHPKIVRRYCPLCKGKRAMPCEHNGAVKVTYEYQTNYRSLLRDPGDDAYRSRWVWPDHAWLYEVTSS